ncbi:hypothetical protein THAOC_11552, partial [Thalassiosira oceanica]
PEEYVAPPPSSTRPDPTSRQVSREGPGTAVPAARARTHSTEAFGGPPAGAATGKGGSTNPFDTPDMAGAAGRKRTSSGNFWGREIDQEGADKGLLGACDANKWPRKLEESYAEQLEQLRQTLDGYYGLNPRDKAQFYGKLPSSSSDVTPQASNSTAHASSTNPFDRDDPAMEFGGPTVPPTTGGSLYDQASAARVGGHGVVDDFSFSNVNLSSPAGVESPGGTDPATSGSLSANNFNKKGGQTSSGLAPPRDGEPWSYGSPRVTFEDAKSSSRGRRRGAGNSSSGAAAFWNRQTTGRKMGIVVAAAAVVCTAMGLAMGQINNNNSRDQSGAASSAASPGYRPNGDRAVGMGGLDEHGQESIELAPPVFLAPKVDDTPSPTPWPETEEPTAKPTEVPTARPTYWPTHPPITLSPVKGYFAIHSKSYDATPSPTREPTTPRPTTLRPTRDPTARPTTDPPVATVQLPPPAPAGCADVRGEYTNHLLNPKTCQWLHNGRDEKTLRKDKNCGGTVTDDQGTIKYEVTELGMRCKATCGEYNGCGAGLAPYHAPMTTEDGTTTTATRACADSPGHFLNHLSNPKTCEWLHNGLGHVRTDRKDKNCGATATTGEGVSVTYETTELGVACPASCAAYANGCDPSSSILGGDGVAGGPAGLPGLEVGEDGMVQRSYVSDEYTFTLKEGRQHEDEGGGVTSTDSQCADGTGMYLDHKRTYKSCGWLTENQYAYHRQDKNCGSANHSVTELGRECMWSCRAFNGCESSG